MGKQGGVVDGVLLSSKYCLQSPLESLMQGEASRRSDALAAQGRKSVRIECVEERCVGRDATCVVKSEPRS